MGKKDKKKGKGAEKTAAKTEKKQQQKLKKQIAAKGEEDLEQVIAQLEQEDKKKKQVVEDLCGPPSRRANFGFVAHPEKDELIVYGGEYFNGQKTYVYGDLYFYNIKKNTWLKVQAPGGPPPRCAHQVVSVAQSGGQLWVFGGEYASPSQSQFYHYRDLWVFHLKEKAWEKINASTGPSARSGHRMVVSQKQLILFGGFHDNSIDYKYFNDLWAFSLENRTWKKLEPTGNGPSPRSGCQMVSLSDGRVLVYGGYSKVKVKKDVDKGTVHTDMFLLTPDKNDTTGLKWKWTAVKGSGYKPSPRTGFSIVAGPSQRAYCFGGVFDEEEDEESISGQFLNDMYILELEKQQWHLVTLTGKKEVKKKKKTDEDEEDEAEADEEPVAESLEAMAIEPTTSTFDDGVFKVTVGGPLPGTSEGGVTAAVAGAVPAKNICVPCGRMGAQLAIKNGVIYLIGGMFEEGDKQFTLADLYSLDLHKMDEWKEIIHDEKAKQEWLDSDSDEEESGDEGSEEEDEDEDDEDMEDEEDMDTD